MDLTILFGVFTVLMLVGTPIAFCLGIASFATVLYLGCRRWSSSSASPRASRSSR